MEFTNQQIRPQSSSKFSPRGIKTIADLGAILINEYCVACHKHQIRVSRKCIENRFDFVRQPKVILIAEKHNLPCRARERRLEGAKNTLIVEMPYQKQTRILQCGDFAACLVCGTIVN